MTPAITVRDAQVSDVPALAAIEGGGEALQRDRLREAQNDNFRYLVLLEGEKVIGYSLLVFRRPSGWSDAARTDCLPQINDLKVEESRRGQGFGSAFLGEMEKLAAAAGCRQIFLAVDPLNNIRAHSLYQRLGYRQIQLEPYHDTWLFTDSDGVVHSGEEWVVDMVKDLSIK
jgi:ribosomal protein S18 acetylase RimI-like enzyme